MTFSATTASVRASSSSADCRDAIAAAWARVLAVNGTYTLPSAVDSITRGVGVKKSRTVRYRNREMLNLNWDFFFAFPGKFVYYSNGYNLACDSLGIGLFRRYLVLNPGGALVYTASRLVQTVGNIYRMLVKPRGVR